MTFAIALWITGSASSAQAPNATQILARCQRAYDTVKTFEQDVSGKTGKGTHMSACSAHISYAKPGRFRAKGAGISGARFDLVVSGATVDVLLTGQDWITAKSPEMGLAMVTGIGGSTPTTVGSLFLHTGWGSLFPPKRIPYLVTEITLAGRPTYCLTSNLQTPTTLWIDKANYFLVKSHKAVMGYSIDLEYSAPKVNQPIPASRFSK